MNDEVPTKCKIARDNVSHHQNTTHPFTFSLGQGRKACHTRKQEERDTENGALCIYDYVAIE